MFMLTNQPIDTTVQKEELRDLRAGAYVEFEGRVRNHSHGKAVTALEYEAYSELARREGNNILSEARTHFEVIDLGAVHRTGRLDLGEVAVWIGVVSAHRKEAFRACQHCIDEVKHRLPIWKRESYLDGQSQWVSCSHSSAAEPSATIV